MRQMISGVVAALAVVAASAAPAMACGGCAPCGYVSPCAGYFGYGAVYERLPDPELQYHSAPTAMPQYYYVNQGPTYTGPGDFAPRPRYYEGGYSWQAYRPYGYRHAYRHHHWNRYDHRPVLHSYY